MAKTKYGVHYPPMQSVALLLLRLALSGLMLTHGFPKMNKLIHGEFDFADPIGIGEVPSLVLVVFAEVVCAVLVGIGLFTRLAAIPLIITMMVAVFIVHAQDPISNKEMGILYMVGYATIAAMGPGKYSIDARLR